MPKERSLWRLHLALALGLIFLPLSGAETNREIAERPFESPSAPRGDRLFVQLSPEATGLRNENRYADPRMWGDRYLEAGVGSIGSGVAVGDYDNDGRPDIFVVSKSDSCRLFRNLGGWKFTDVSDAAGVSDIGAAALVWKQGATFADVNNDGWLDLYVCRFEEPNLLYISQGDGTFRESAQAYGLDVRDASGVAAFFDFDRDGWLDVFIQTNLLNISRYPNGQRNHLFHNNRDGTFSNVTAEAGISGEAQGHSATCWDQNEDGWTDIYIANDFGVPDKLYRNNGNGTFTDGITSVVPHTTFASMGSDLGDINNDGHIDFYVADMAATTHEKDQRTASDIRSGAEDLAEDSRLVPKYLHNALYLNTGTGRCLEGAYLAGIAATDWTWSVRFEDLDNDGRLDLFVTNGMNREQSNVDLIAREMRAESAAERIRIMRESPVMEERNLAFRNLGDLEFKNVSAEWGLDELGVSFGAAVGDLDGDGDLDVVTVNYQKSVSVFRNDSDRGHRLIVDLRGVASNRYGVGTTVRIETATGVQVRQLVLARGYMSSNEPMVHFGLGEDTVIKRMVLEWPSGRVQAFADLPVDRRYTVTEPTENTAAATARERPVNRAFVEEAQLIGFAFVPREEPVDEVSVQRLLPMRFDRRGPALAVSDVDGDGFDDVAVGGSSLEPVRLFRGSAAGGFAGAEGSIAAPRGPVDDGPLLFFDANADGKPDLLVTKGGNSLPAESPEYGAKLFLNDGRGGFRPAPEGALPLLPMSVGAAATADFDRDGRLDLFLGARLLPGLYPLPPTSALLANRNGRFEDVTESLARGLREVGMVTAALWSDVDGDGWQDLVLAVEWGSLRYFHNVAGRRFEDRTDAVGFAAGGTGWWTSLASADFNGDGRPDFVVGNVGLNTQYHADADHPTLLFSGDFNGNGEEPQIVEAYHEGDRIFPWRTRKDLGAAIPAVRKKYPRNDVFASATVQDIFGADRLAAATRFAATELRSGVWLSQPDGPYSFTALPRVAQIAPIQGLAAGDFDGDGKADIYALQNTYAPVPSIGRFDGGLSQLLLGDGRGHFIAVAPKESNLIVPGDAKALAVVDFNHDGWPDFLISRNGASSLAYRSTRVVGRNFLRIQLRDLPGNPGAIGARITVEMRDESIQSSEVRAGSGYYSQASAAGFFGYVEANPPKRVHVRWPSGVSGDYEPPSDGHVLTLVAPSARNP